MESNTEYIATQTGTARIRGLKWDSVSGNTSYPDSNHSNYRAYLYDIDTSNSVTGTVQSACTDILMVQLNLPANSKVEKGQYYKDKTGSKNIRKIKKLVGNFSF